MQPNCRSCHTRQPWLRNATRLHTTPLNTVQHVAPHATTRLPRAPRHVIDNINIKYAPVRKTRAKYPSTADERRHVQVAPPGRSIWLLLAHVHVVAPAIDPDNASRSATRRRGVNNKGDATTHRPKHAHVSGSMRHARATIPPCRRRLWTSRTDSELTFDI